MAAASQIGPLASSLRATTGDPLFQVSPFREMRRLVTLYLLFSALSPASLLSLVNPAATASTSSAERCSVNSSVCDSHQSEGKTASFFEAEKKEGGTHAVKLQHASSIPGLGFLQWKDAQRSTEQHVPPKALQHAIKQAFYAYPLYEDDTFKVHVHRRGQKQLLRDLHQAGAFELHAEETKAEEWSLMQAVAQGYKSK
ncbi:hypothetical protein ACSSS7_000174 [Eimeria intestinalis]